MDKPYYVYILKSQKDSHIYIGITNNPERRLKQHNAGKNLSTKYRTPFILIRSEKYKNRKIAREREKFLKSGCGREWIKKEISPP